MVTSNNIKIEEVEMQRNFQYKEKDLLGGWSIEVKNGSIVLGNIRKNPSSGAFQYFSGRNNILNPSFEENNLDDLKRRIEK